MEGNKKKRVVVHFNRLKKCCSPKQQSEETKLEERTQISKAVPDVDADRNTAETADVGDPVQQDWIVMSYKKDSPFERETEPSRNFSGFDQRTAARLEKQSCGSTRDHTREASKKQKKTGLV